MLQPSYVGTVLSCGLTCYCRFALGNMNKKILCSLLYCEMCAHCKKNNGKCARAFVFKGWVTSIGNIQLWKAICQIGRCCCREIKGVFSSNQLLLQFNKRVWGHDHTLAQMIIQFCNFFSFHCFRSFHLAKQR